MYKIIHNFFKKIFNSIINKKILPDDNYGNDAADSLTELEYKFINSNKKFIQSRLRWICNNRHIVTVYMIKESSSFQSVVLDVDVIKGFIKIDKQLNRELEKRLNNAINIEIICDISGVKFSFKTTVIKVFAKNDLNAIYLKIPLFVFWYQRRLNERVYVPKTHVGSYFEYSVTDLQQITRVTIENIGYHGFLLSTNNQQFVKLVAPGVELIGKISLHQIGGAPVKIAVRHVENTHIYNNGRTVFKVGCEILDNSAELDNIINNYFSGNKYP